MFSQVFIHSFDDLPFEFHAVPTPLCHLGHFYTGPGVDRMQRNFEPMRKQVEAWRSGELTTVTAKMIIYEAFIESELEVPKHLAQLVHDHYFQPRTMWSLSNALRRHSRSWIPFPVPAGLLGTPPDSGGPPISGGARAMRFSVDAATISA
jgi:hypothetical protein